MLFNEPVRLSESGHLGVCESPAFVERAEVCNHAERRAVNMSGIADPAEAGDERENLAD